MLQLYLIPEKAHPEDSHTRSHPSPSIAIPIKGSSCAVTCPHGKCASCSECLAKHILENFDE